MFFGQQPFASAAFASEFIQNARVIPTGEELTIRVGNIEVDFGVPVTGNRFNLANGDVSVIIWNEIPAGANQVWVAIDPDDP